MLITKSSVRKDLNQLRRLTRKIKYILAFNEEKSTRVQCLQNQKCNKETLARYGTSLSSFNLDECLEKSSAILEKYQDKISALSPNEHAIFKAIYLEGDKHKDIAIKRDCSISLIQQQVSSIIAKLSK